MYAAYVLRPREQSLGGILFYQKVQNDSMRNGTSKKFISRFVPIGTNLEIRFYRLDHYMNTSFARNT